MTALTLEGLAEAIYDAINEKADGDGVSLAMLNRRDGWINIDGLFDPKMVVAHLLSHIEASGYKIVPVELTKDMRREGEQEMMARHTNLDCFLDPYVDSTWGKMLAASPEVR